MTTPRSVAPASWTALLLPRWLAVVHAPAAATPGRRLAGVLFALLGLLFWVALFFGAWWFFRRCVEVELVGPLLVRKILDMAFLVFLSVLFFSNVVAAFSTFFLADDLTLVMALPVDADRVWFARLAETTVHSSWMIAIFGLPILVAAGWVFSAGPVYYLLALAALIPFLAIPAVLGSVVTLLLVLVFPARRARDLLLLLGILSFCVLFVLFRLLRPEQLLDDRQFGDMVSFLAAFQTPGADWLPATWLVRVIFPALRGEPTAGLADLGMLWLTAGALLVPSTWLARSQLRRAYSRSLEGGDGLAGQTRTKSIRLRFSTSPILEILRKDALLFARDPSQWSQVMLLVALVVVYIVNFKNFQLLGTAGLISELGLYYLNLGLTGFVLAAVGTRLIFPSISLEGKAFWLLRTAPMPLERILLAKWLGGLWPLLLLGGSTILVTDRMIGTPWHLSLISATTTVLLAGLVSAMGTGLGALFPSFDAENATRVASGFGGIVYMVLTMSTVVLVLALQAWPVWLLHKGLSTPRAFAAGTVAIAVGLALGSLLLAALAIVVPLRLGARSLRQLEG